MFELMTYGRALSLDSRAVRIIRITQLLDWSVRPKLNEYVPICVASAFGFREGKK